jgi:hypothetical protein
MSPQDDLFSARRDASATPPAPAARAPADASGPPVIATCRSNILDWLSSGLLTPRAAFDKYYEDSLAVRDDLVPVVRAPVGGDLLAVEARDDGNFPVLVEVDEEAVTWVRDGRAGYVVRAPLTAVRAVHFARDDDVREFGARRFENLTVNRVAHRTSPDLFDDAGDGPSTESLARDLRGVRSTAPAITYDLADRLSGARAMALVAASGSTKTLHWAVEMTFGPRTARPPRKKLKTPEEWVLLNERLAEYKVPTAATLDERLFRATAATLLSIDRADVGDPGAILAEIDRHLDDDKTLKDADRSTWTTARDGIAGALEGTSRFSRFRSDAFRTEKALMLALLRPEPTSVLTWTTETRAGPRDLVVAALLVGLAHGRKTLPTVLRPPLLDDRLARRELDDLDGRDVEVQAELVEGGAGLTLRIDDLDVQTMEKPPPALVELLDAVDLGDAETSAAMAGAAAARGWHHAVTTRLTIPGELRIRARDSRTEIEADGVVEPRLHLRADAFRDALVGLEDEELRELLGRLATEGPSTPGSPSEAGLQRDPRA